MGAMGGRIERRFVKGMKTYAEANSTGSRGVYLYFVLSEGPLYEIFDRPGWGKTRRRFARVIDGALHDVSTEDALQWVSNGL